MSNFKQDILAAIDGNEIIACRIERFEPYWDEDDPRYAPGNFRAGELLPLSEFLELMDYDYNSGFGSQECHNVCLWSATRVYFIHEYDGSTALVSEPRNPEAIDFA